MKKGFTLIELLAVIVILAIILAISVPRISSILDNSRKNSFEASAKLWLKTVGLKLLENNNFNLATINKSTIESLLNIDADNYSQVYVRNDSNGKLYTLLKGTGQWDNLTAIGSFENITVGPTEQIVTDGLVAYFEAGNNASYSGNGTTWYDISGSGINAQGLNNPVFSSDNFGYFNFSTNKAFNTPVSATLNITNNLTLETFVYPTANINYGGIITYGTDGAEQYTLTTMATQKYMCGTNYPSNWYQVYGDVYSLNVWQHVVATFSSGVWNIYINGVLNATNTIPITNFPSIANSYLSIGLNFPGGDEYYSGKISLVRIYNKVLNGSEILQNFNAQKIRYGL